MNWYFLDESIKEGERRIGPLKLDEIQEKVNAGQIKESTLVWHTGLPDWVSWEQAKLEMENKETTQIIQDTLTALIKEKEFREALKERSKFAGFWIRAAAYIIDYGILCFLSAILAMLLNFFGIFDLTTANELFNEAKTTPVSTELMEKFLEINGMQFFLSLCSVIQVLYFVLFNGIRSGTPGKLLFKIKIIRADGKPLGIFYALVRYFCSVLTSVISIYLYGLAYIIAAFDPEKRALHDWIAKTRVVRKDSENRHG